jgi:signal transduction histidine kinase
VILESDKIKPLKKLKTPSLKSCQTGPGDEKMDMDFLDFMPFAMIVSSLEGEVVYLNDAFTQMFAWTQDDIKASLIQPVPAALMYKAGESLKDFHKAKSFRFETKWLTKDKGSLDVDVMGSFFRNEKGSLNVVFIIRDIAVQKKSKLINDALLRISTALPSYPVLEDLMDYISEEISRLLNTDGALVMLLDDKTNEIFFQGAGLDDSNNRKHIKKIRIPADKSITGKVIRTGIPLIIHDTAEDPDYYPGVDEQLNVLTKNMLIVPLRNSDRIIGVLNAVNKKAGRFDNTDLELLKMISGTVALSVENARVSSQLKDAYDEVISLNRAKDRVINHLSHELKTPVSILMASINLIARRLGTFPDGGWSPTLERAKRNLERILELQYELEDIMHDREYRTHGLLSFLLDECTDELESLIAEEIGEGAVNNRIRNRIEEIFGPGRGEITENDIGDILTETLNILKPQYSHRDVEVVEDIKETSPVRISKEALSKTLAGLIRNAIENTPDEGRIEVFVINKQDGVEFTLRDYGIGITEVDQKRIFEGFYPTQETMQYSSKRPFDFNAGGKGADLLRIRIFSERYHFQIHMESLRCRFIPQKDNICPGSISRCVFCSGKEDCQNSGGTTFNLFFPHRA